MKLYAQKGCSIQDAETYQLAALLLKMGYTVTVRAETVPESKTRRKCVIVEGV